MSWLPVLDGDRHVVGTLSLSDLMRSYRRELLANVARVSGLTPGSAGFEVTITADSPAAGKRLRAAGLSKGIIVTSITRGEEVVLPSGDTLLAVGDRLSLLGEGAGRRGSVSSPRLVLRPGVHLKATPATLLNGIRRYDL